MRMIRIGVLFMIVGATAGAQEQKTLSGGVNALAEQVITGLSAGKRKVAVIPLKTLKGETNTLGAYISEELGTILATQKIQVIERALLNTVLDEIHLQETGAIDPATAKRVGTLSGADAIITGTIAELPTTLRINCRVIATQTGEVLTGARTVISIDADVLALSGRPPVEQYIPFSNAKAVEPNDAEKSWKRGDVRYVVDGTDRSRTGVYLTIALEHEKADPVNVDVDTYHLIDDRGDRYDFAHDSERFVKHGVTIPPGTRARSSFFFYCKGQRAGTKFSVIAADGTTVLRDLIIPKKR